MNRVREMALQVLCSVINDGGYSNLTLRSLPSSVTERDQALLTELVYGTLRNYRYLGYQWADFVHKEPEARLAVLLNMSVYQLFYLNKVPDYAVVNEAVTLARSFAPGQAAFINAVLRKVLDRGIIKPNSGDAWADLALMTSHPEWLVKLWRAHYGEEITRSLCLYNEQRPQTALRVNTLKVTREVLLADHEFTKGRLAADAVYYHGDIFTTAYFTNGLVAVQDEASQLVAPFCGVQPGMRVLDLCSAPGTKAAHLAALMHNEGQITAVDIYPQRVALIRKTIERLNTTIIEPRCADATQVSELLTPATYDLVLVDAPCSGLGVMRHKPEIKLNIKPEALDDLVVIQHAILAEAAKMVKPGGQLVYATCTLDKKENERQVERFVTEQPFFQKLTEQTILPMEYDTDGFYMAKLRRIE